MEDTEAQGSEAATTTDAANSTASVDTSVASIATESAGAASSETGAAASGATATSAKFHLSRIQSEFAKIKHLAEEAKDWFSAEFAKLRERL